MDFKEISLHQAENTVLAHSLNLLNGKLKKGTVLSREDVMELEENGYRSVMVAILSAEDISENIAAENLASVIAGDLVDVQESITGRCNLRANKDGLLVIDKLSLDKINLVHESLTVATLEPFIPVYRGQLIATIKIIPYAVADSLLQACLTVAKEAGSVIRVAPFNPKSVGFIQTSVNGFKQNVLDKTSKVLSQRLERLNSHISQEIRCQHDSDEVAKAIKQFQSKVVDILIISGATAVADRNDVIPSAIVNCGGEIIHFGMPVDPGNLLLLGNCDEKYVLGMPGCARSPKFNGFDIVLDRLIADVPVTSRDIMQMGLGGLLKEIADRPQPRMMQSGKHKMKKTNNVTAIVLAAGQSHRMGDENKLLMKIDDSPMIEHVAKTLNESCLNEIIVVTGFEAEQIKSALNSYDLRFVNNPDFDKGLSTSLVAGLRSVDEMTDAVIICLGDMPMVTSTDIKQLINEFNPDEGREICVPTYQGKRGNPILWSRRFINEMLQLEGDVGAKHLLFKYDDIVHEVPIQDSGILLDFDTQETISNYQDK
ncbi:MAG: molybdopterin-binding/glycosyltransferase family 2 protein [Gammaproteobacteria bacterium]